MIAPDTLITAVVGLKPGSIWRPAMYSVPAATGSTSATISRMYCLRYSAWWSRQMAWTSSSTLAASSRYITGMKKAAQYQP